MEQITFPLNQPVTVAMKYDGGLNRFSRTYGNYVSFATVDGRVFCLSPEAAASIKALKIQPGEPFTIEKRQEPNNKHSWVIARLDLQSELDSASRRGVYGVRPAPVSPFPSPAPASRPTVQGTRGTGTNGPAPKPVAVAGKIPVNVAVGEILDFVNETLNTRGENWDNHTKQALVCTIFIDQSRAGRIGPWER
jgi:hypothetical protein